MTLPAMAGPSLTRTAITGAEQFNGAVVSNLRATGDPYVYNATAQTQGGYYRPMSADEYWVGEYLLTTAPGAFTMTGFTAGWVAPTGAGATEMYVDFFDDDGYLPYAGNYVGGYTIPVTNDGYGHIEEYDTTGDGMNFATANLWMTYSFDVQDYFYDPNVGPSSFHEGMGPYHADPPSIGTDYYANGWIQYDTAGYHWYGYTGGFPNGDLLAAIQVPEPATLALLGLGGLAVLRRRR
jgi:hypothetical protein